MSYQSEAQLEAQLIEQLQSQNYTKVVVPDYDSLLANFKTQFERFNSVNLGGKPLSAKEWERVLNYVNGKSIFESAKILRDKFVLELDDASKVYVALLDEDFSKNIFQVTNQTTVVGKYTNRYDVTILVNGLPLVQIELKRRGVDIKEGLIRSCVTANTPTRASIILSSCLWFLMALIRSILPTAIRIFCTRTPSSGLMTTISV